MALSLNQTLDAGIKFGGPDFYKNRVPEFLYQNLKQSYNKRIYQQEAFGRFIFYWNDYHEKPKGVPLQLLFHMATGSGKTLVMAGLIVYLYEIGYRNFLFFVNSTNIIEKTRDNFLNRASSKYLFSEQIVIRDKHIQIKEVDNFQGANSEDINIVFSTIQGLHSRLNTPRENSLTFDDFEDKKIVLLSDEAHHINAETKKGAGLSLEEKEEIISWEGTVYRIFTANSENILLEFTATADFTVPEIINKYQDKLIFDYPLRQFRLDGFSKEVKVLQADLPQFQRALQAILLSQYRRKVFEKNKKHIKPVLLFKSKTIKESQDFFREFNKGIKNLSVVDLEKIKKNNTDPVIIKIFNYLASNNISLENLVSELREDFNENKLITINSKDESEQKQLDVNTLEDEDNEFRAVFAVDKLNEGWDVLNLYDIVRLYDTRDAKQGKPGRTTMSEAQLIGRGARYCPFQITWDQPIDSRKFDGEPNNELRICEELFYHSAYNPRYIQELNTALEEIGVKAKETREKVLNLKKEFTETSFYKSGLLFINELQKYNREDVFGLDKKTIIGQVYKIVLKTGYIKASTAFGEIEKDGLNRKVKDYKLLDFGEIVIRKAINKLDFYRFSNLKRYLPNLKSITEFITSDNYLGGIQVEVSGLLEQLDNLSIDGKLEIALNVLDNVSLGIVSDKIEFKGSNQFNPVLLKDKIFSKPLNFAIDEGGDREFGRSMNNPGETSIYLDLSKRDWYAFDDCYGTSEEKFFVKFIDKVYEKLKLKYDEIYLVRNERHFKLFNFDDGKPVEPDFVLFLVRKESSVSLHYQVFIEPKGAHLLKTDEVKEQFLKSLNEKHKLDQLWKSRKYVIWGMPFFNEELKKVEFEGFFNKLFV